MNEIYLDNSATTRLCCSSVKAMLNGMENIYGNPSSLHSVGLTAEKAVKNAKEQILRALRATGGGQLIFCSCGTEANNLALLGVARSKERYRGGRIIITDSEHPSVEECARTLEKEGFEVVRLSTRGGVIDKGELAGAITPKTFLISIMSVNNETGADYRVSELFALAKSLKSDVITHTDAVQAFLKIPVSPTAMKADLITVSSHKVHGPKGVGALYIGADMIKQKNISPIIFGGGQEGGLRSGTENTPGIIGFGAACSEVCETLGADNARMTLLRDRLCSKMPDGIKVKKPSGGWAPHIINITLPNIKSETMLHYLSEKSIFVSSGSACSSHGKGENRVLTAFGCNKKEADCSLRISLSRENTEDDINALVSALTQGISSIVQI